MHLKDSYGDHGQVGLLILKKIEKTILVSNFLLSCRILGRYLENWILKKITEIMTKKNCDKIIFEFKKTKKNQVTQDFIKKNNFIKLTKKSLMLKNMNFKKNDNVYYHFDTQKKINFINIYE